MKLSKGIQMTVIAVLFIGIAAYIVYAMVTPKTELRDERCAELVINIEGAEDAAFLSNKSIEDQLHRASIHPKGQRLSDISAKKIIETLKQNQFISTVNCYKTANGKVVIDVRQCTPVLYILPDHKEGYYVDADGKVIKNTDYPANILTATGNINQKFATTCLCYLGAYICEDDFLDNLIEQVYVSRTNDGHFDINLVPRVGEQKIHLGSITNYAKKLERLKKFYQNALTSVGWNKYSSIDLEYNNQIICKKTK